MDFPFGVRQPSQKIALDLLAAFTPEGLPDLMTNRAIEIGTPLHDEHYSGHSKSVDDEPLGALLKYELEHPRHCETDQIPTGKYRYQS